MAENESLDLYSRHAQRWSAVRDAALKGGSCQKVSTVTKKKLYEAFRKVVRQFRGYGVTTAGFLAARGSQHTLRSLLRQTEWHPYAKLLISVLNANPDSDGAECLKKWGHSALDMVFDQIRHGLAGTDHIPSFFESQLFFCQVRNDLDADIERIATKLGENPEWEPRRAASKRASEEEATAELMPMSLLVGGSSR